MIEFHNPTAKLDGIEYKLELGKIESTHIGFEDHGIFSVNVNFEFPGSSQGTGHYGFDSGMQFQTFILGFLKVTGVSQWEDLVDTQIYVMREKPFSDIKGLLSLDRTRSFILADVFGARLDSPVGV